MHTSQLNLRFVFCQNLFINLKDVLKLCVTLKLINLQNGLQNWENSHIDK